MASEIWFDFPELPVSVNRLYRSLHGNKVLTDAGKRYRNKFITSGGGASKADLMSFHGDVHREYELLVWCFLPRGRLYSTTFGIDKRVKHPFQRVDVDNYEKLVVDCVAKLVGLDDRNNFTVCFNKRESKSDEERIVALLRPLDLENDPHGIEHFRATPASARTR